MGGRITFMVSGPTGRAEVWVDGAWEGEGWGVEEVVLEGGERVRLIGSPARQQGVMRAVADALGGLPLRIRRTEPVRDDDEREIHDLTFAPWW